MGVGAGSKKEAEIGLGVGGDSVLWNQLGVLNRE